MNVSQAQSSNRVITSSTGTHNGDVCEKVETYNEKLTIDMKHGKMKTI